MDLIEIKSDIIEIIKRMKGLLEFDESTQLIKEGLIDSFDIMNLVILLEDKFNVSIDGEDLTPESFMKVKKIVELIRRKLMNNG